MASSSFMGRKNFWNRCFVVFHSPGFLIASLIIQLKHWWGASLNNRVSFRRENLSVSKCWKVKFLLNVKWGVHCQLNDANYLFRIFTAATAQISSRNLSNYLHKIFSLAKLFLPLQFILCTEFTWNFNSYCRVKQSYQR